MVDSFSAYLLSQLSSSCSEEPLENNSPDTVVINACTWDLILLLFHSYYFMIFRLFLDDYSFWKEYEKSDYIQ